MKKYLIIILTSLYTLSYAQTPNWQWAKSSTGSGEEHGESITTDASGNVFITGSFDGTTVSFGSTPLARSGTNGSYYLTKYDASGNVKWAKTAIGSGAGNEWGSDVITDAAGNVYVTGVFTSDTVKFGSTVLINSAASSFSPRNELFIAKYDSSGNVLWAKKGSGDGDDVGRSITSDNSGNIYITGHFSSSTLSFGSTTITNTGSNTSDFFIAKLNATTGNVIWVKGGGGAKYDSGESIATDPSGNVFITGTYKSSTATFGSTVLTNAGTSNAFVIAKYNSSGTLLWAKGSGGTYSDFGTGIATDANGNAYVSGVFSSATMSFGSIILTNNAATATDIFVVKYDGSGTAIWAKNAGGGNNDAVSDIATDQLGNAYITGRFWSPTASFGSTTLTRVGGDDLFVAKYNSSNGTLLWALGSGGSNNEEGQSIAIDANGYTYITGFFYSTTLTLGATSLSNPSGGSSGSANMFVGRLSSTLIGIEEETQVNSLSVFPNPTTNSIYIDLKEDVIVRLYNISSQLILEQNLQMGKRTLDLSSLSPGIYIGVASSVDKNCSFKIVKQY